MIKFTTQELEMEKSLKQRIGFICEFCHVTPTIINGNIRKVDKTNLTYLNYIGQSLIILSFLPLIILLIS